MPSKPVLLLTAAALACATLAAAKETPPELKEGPDDAVFQARPGLAAGGRGVMRCKVSATGVLSDCGVLRETPSGAGAGRAMIDLRDQFKVDPATRDGVAVGSEIVIANSWYPHDTEPDWLRKPTPNDLLAVFPRAALEAGVGGRARINCLVSTRGVLFECVVLSEEPAGLGFGSAAIALTPQFLMKPATHRGQPTLNGANLPIRFPDPGFPRRDPRNLGAIVPPASVWIQAPAVADVIAVYPKRARAERKGGRATVNCHFAPSGRLERCQTMGESPQGLGFGAAAVAVAQNFQAGAAAGGALKKALVQLPISFDPAMLEPDAAVTGKPKWAALPTDDHMKAALVGLPKGIGSVRVALSCLVVQGGRLSECSVASEEQAGNGFGQAALSLTPRFQMATWTDEGLPVVGGRIRLPLRFETGEAPAPAPAK